MLTHHKAFLFHTHIMIQFCCMAARRELMKAHVMKEILYPTYHYLLFEKLYEYIKQFSNLTILILGLELSNI